MPSPSVVFWESIPKESVNIDKKLPVPVNSVATPS